jgi:hypothetical protein
MRKSIGFRLTLWYSIFFPLNSLVVFGLIYFLLSSYMNRKDREIIESKLEEYTAQYEAEGMEALRNEVRLENRVDQKNSFFVHVAGRENTALFVSVPKLGTSFDYQYLEGHNIHDRWIDLETGDDDYVVEVRSSRLPDGSFLQIGKSTENREELLERFREIFAGIMIPVILLGFVGGGVSFVSGTQTHPQPHEYRPLY